MQKIVSQISSQKSVKRLRIFNSNGNIKYSDNPTEISKNINEIQSGHVGRKIDEIKERSIVVDKENNIYKVIQPLFIEDRCKSCHSQNNINSFIDIDSDFTDAEIRFYTGSVHFIILGLESVERGNLKLRLPVEGKDEFLILNYHDNRMVNELKSSKEKINEMQFEQLQRADKMVTLCFYGS